MPFSTHVYNSADLGLEVFQWAAYLNALLNGNQESRILAAKGVSVGCVPQCPSQLSVELVVEGIATFQWAAYLNALLNAIIDDKLEQVVKESFSGLRTSMPFSTGIVSE